MIESVYTCDSCGSESEHVDADELPEGWLYVEDVDFAGHYCTSGCATSGLLTGPAARTPLDEAEFVKYLREDLG